MAKKALEGLKVADFGYAIAAPLTALCLAHHGATVVRVESMHKLDTTRVGSPNKDNIRGINRSADYTSYNSNKYGMSLNLSHQKGVEVARRLVAWSDIIGENFTPGVMKRLGLGYDELREVKPDIIMYSTSNLGQTGPESTQPGYGLMLVSYSGFTHLTGWPDRMPAQPFAVYTDFITPPYLAVSVIAALDYRRRTGEGQYIDLAQMEAGLQFVAPAIMDYTINQRVQTRDGNRCSYAAPHGAYPCQGDDRWCTIAVFNDEEWDALCRVMDNPKWTKEAKFTTILNRKGNEEELDTRLGEWTINYTAEEVMEKLQAAGVSAGVVKSSADIQDDPQLAHRNYYWQLEHPEIGVHCYDGSVGFNLSKTPYEINMPAPLLGQHTEYVCREILNMSDEEFIDLFRQGVFE